MCAISFLFIRQIKDFLQPDIGRARSIKPWENTHTPMP